MNGILLLNKEKNITSFKIIEKLKEKFHIKKIGHAGTLDPIGEGLLIALINKATKINQYLNFDKEYIIEILFGIKTDTDDITGKIIEKSEVPYDLDKKLKNILYEFQGELLQTPPLYSAIKIGGIPSYKLARKGKKFNIPPKKIKIHKIDLLDIQKDKIKLKILCSHGTYMRALARDLGEKLNIPATLFSLKRTRIGPFSIEQSVRISEIDDLKKYLIPIKDALLNMDEYIINSENLYKRVKNGAPIKLKNKKFNFNFIKIIFKDEVIAIGYIENEILKIKRVL